MEWEVPITPIGRLCPALAGRIATVWADQRSIQITVDGQLIRTTASRFSTNQLQRLLTRGRPAGPEPATSAAGSSPNTAVELGRTVSRDGDIAIGGQRLRLAAHLAGQHVTLRFAGPMLHITVDGKLIKTLSSPIPAQQRRSLVGAREATTALPRPPAPPLKAVRKVGSNGTFMIANQKLRVGRSHAGKTVTVIVDDTVFRVLDGDIELGSHVRLKTKPQQRFPWGRTPPSTPPTGFSRSRLPFISRTAGVRRSLLPMEIAAALPTYFAASLAFRLGSMRSGKARAL